MVCQSFFPETLIPSIPLIVGKLKRTKRACGTAKKRSSYENERKYTLRIETKRKLRIDRQGFAGLAGADGARDSAAYVGGNGAGTVTAPARVGLLSVRGVGVRTMFGMVPHRAVAGARLCVSDSYTRLSVCLILHIR